MRWVGLVRNVMIGREGLHRDVLLQLLADAGAKDGRSHLATGNLTFTAPERDVAGVVRRLEEGIAAVIGRPEPVVIRRHPWFQELVATDPFASYDRAEWELLVAFLPLQSPPIDPSRIGPVKGTVILRVSDHELIGARPAGGRAPHVLVLAERAAGCKATSRGWSTVVRLSQVA